MGLSSTGTLACADFAMAIAKANVRVVYKTAQSRVVLLANSHGKIETCAETIRQPSGKRTHT